jgi:hypothetical protein
MVMICMSERQFLEQQGESVREEILVASVSQAGLVGPWALLWGQLPVLLGSVLG